MTNMHPHLHCLHCGFPIDLSDVVTVSAIGWTCDLVEGNVIYRQCPNCSRMFRLIRVFEVVQFQSIQDCCSRPRLIQRRVHNLKDDGRRDGTSRLEAHCINCKKTHTICKQGKSQ